jgi:hypothetical protein
LKSLALVEAAVLSAEEHRMTSPGEIIEAAADEDHHETRHHQ